MFGGSARRGDADAGAATAPAADRSITAPRADDASKPRRTGWWAKRLLGGDKG